MKFIYYLSLFVLLVSDACKPSKTSPGKSENKIVNEFSSHHSPSDYQQIAESKLGKNVNYVLNKAHTMVLCQTVALAPAPALVNSSHFLIILLKNNTVLYEDQIANAQVEWHNTTQLKINIYPGTMLVTPDKPKTYYLYDVETKRKLFPPGDKF